MQIDFEHMRDRGIANDVFKIIQQDMFIRSLTYRPTTSYDKVNSKCIRNVNYY